MNSSFYKFGLSEPTGSTSYYDVGHAYEVHRHNPNSDDYRRSMDDSSTMSRERTATLNSEWEGYTDTHAHENPIECKF